MLINQDEYDQLEQAEYDQLQQEVDTYRTALKMISSNTMGNSRELADKALKIFDDKYEAKVIVNVVK